MSSRRCRREVPQGRLLALIKLPQTGDGLTLQLQGLLTAGSFRMLTRRISAAGLATLPVTTTTATTSVAVDPIHAALLRHRVTKAALGLIDEVTEPARYAAAKQELNSSFDALITIVPQTMDGARALVSFMTESADEVGTDARSLDILHQALDRRAVVLAHRLPIALRWRRLNAAADRNAGALR